MPAPAAAAATHSPQDGPGDCSLVASVGVSAIQLLPAEGSHAKPANVSEGIDDRERPKAHRRTDRRAALRSPPTDLLPNPPRA